MVYHRFTNINLKTQAWKATAAAIYFLIPGYRPWFMVCLRSSHIDYDDWILGLGKYSIHLFSRVFGVCMYIYIYVYIYILWGTGGWHINIYMYSIYIYILIQVIKSHPAQMFKYPGCVFFSAPSRRAIEFKTRPWWMVGPNSPSQDQSPNKNRIWTSYPIRPSVVGCNLGCQVW